VWDLGGKRLTLVEPRGRGSSDLRGTATGPSRSRGRRLAVVTAFLLAQALSACGSGGPEPREAANEGGGGRLATGGTAAVLDPGRTEMHRLNTVEYNATVEDVLGTTLQPANGNWRGGELGGFDNIASVLGVDEAR
jgi:hypothetical protein